MHVPVTAIGIHTGVEHDNGAVKEFAVACRQGLHGRHGRFRADRFVAMDVVAEVHPNNPFATVHAFIHPAHVVGPKRVEAVHVFGRRHDEAQQWAAFCRRPILLQFPMGHDLRHVFEVVHDQVVAGERFAKFMPDDGLRVGLTNPRKGRNEHKNDGKKAAAVGPRIHDGNIGRRAGRVVCIKNHLNYVTFRRERPFNPPRHSTFTLQQHVPWTPSSNFTSQRV
jgi:hypothetical protein